MIGSGNALPTPAYGIRARRIPIRYLQKLHLLLKGLLKANLVSFSDNQWASPIVIVLKKNGQDIRLCIDYKMVNAVTAIMKYAMPLVDDLLTDLDSYLWFCSLDAVSEFWANMKTHRAHKISAFVYPLGHFEWLRMPFGLQNAPMIMRCGDSCSRRVDDKMKAAEVLAKGQNEYSAEHSAKSWGEPPMAKTKFAAAQEDVGIQDPV
ncbi:reverse transcriptase [Phytophthora megakarya]|uniref:Reverse transcriptase n=1 Tax=Phytophthora megakarya TaxID=4795 RepID=A0A225WE68_9STRA|nr:reverse transcriptase [Phytophthora megakarya]